LAYPTYQNSSAASIGLNVGLTYKIKWGHIVSSDV
jgi:hypothetical protein